MQNNALVIPKLGISITDKFRTGTALALIPLMIAIGGWACNVQQVQTIVTRVNSILVEVSPALQIVSNLLPLLSGKDVPASVVSSINEWIPKVQADIPKIQDLVQQYQNDLTNATLQGKLNAILSTTAQDITSILPVFNVLDTSTQQKVNAIVTAISAAVVSVENIINAASGKASLNKAGIFSSGKDFKAKFNTTLHSPTGDKEVDAATAKLKL